MDWELWQSVWGMCCGSKSGDGPWCAQESVGLAVIVAHCPLHLSCLKALSAGVMFSSGNVGGMQHNSLCVWSWFAPQGHLSVPDLSQAGCTVSCQSRCVGAAVRVCEAVLVVGVDCGSSRALRAAHTYISTRASGGKVWFSCAFARLVSTVLAAGGPLGTACDMLECFCCPEQH